MNLELDGRVAFVAGASRGIGLAIARGFLEEGARVAIGARDALALEEARRTLARDFDAARILAFPGDLGNADHIEAALAATEERLGPLYAAIGAIGSGRGPMDSPLARTDWEDALNANLLPSVLLAEAALARMTRPEGGSILLIGSIAGSEALAAPIPYSAAKAALKAAVKGFARRAARRNVRVNAILPGNILHPDSVWEKKRREDAQALDEYLAREVPLGRLGTPEEIASVALFLSSPKASFMTASMVTVDGGQTRSFL